MSDTESTSAQLRQTQQALAASQADLTAMEQQRNGLRSDLTKAAERHHVLWRLERDTCVKLRQERELARAELSTARQELEQLRSLYRAGNRHRDGLRAEISYLRDELLNTRIECDSAWDGVKKISAHRDQLAQDLQISHQSVRHWSRENNALQQRVSQQAIELSQLQAERQKLAEQVAWQEDLIHQLRNGTGE